MRSFQQKSTSARYATGVSLTVGWRGRCFMISFVNTRMRRAGSTIVLVTVAISIVVMPLSTRACVGSRRAELGCSCCTKKVCCAGRDKKDGPVTQPLATNGDGYQLTLNITPTRFAVGCDFPSGNPSAQATPHRQGVSPPTRVLLCTFLI